jgi:glycosyltransferase involved in cell wall biosynthesis
MKIAMVAEPFVPIPPKKYGGVERVIYFIIKGLQDRGHEVILLGPGDSEVDCQIIPICPKHLFFGKNDKEQQEIIKKNKKIRLKTIDILKKILPDVDVIHSHGLDLTPFKNFPNVTTLHGMFVLPQIEYFRERRNLNYVSISKSQRTGYPTLNYVGNVYNGLDADEFPFIEKPKNYLCFIGRFDREKNPVEAILLAKQLKMKIKLAGKLDFQGKKYFEEIIKPYFDDPLVEYIGEVDMKQKIELVGNAKLNLHPINFREPFGLTVVEAAYMGTPTLAIGKGSMAEIIENGRSGILVEDFAEGYHLIDKCFSLNRKYVSSRARSLFNHRTMAEGYEHVYKKVIARHKFKNKSNGHRENFFSEKINLEKRNLSPIEVFWQMNHN